MGSMVTICTVLGIVFLVLGFGFALWDEFLRKKRLILEKKYIIKSWLGWHNHEKSVKFNSGEHSRKTCGLRP